METKRAIKPRLVDVTGSQWDGSGHPVLTRIFLARGISSPDALDLSLQGLLPFDLLGHTQEAAKLLADALVRQEKIIIVADFDVDGASSAALMVRVLQAMGASDVDYLVPNRFKHGYGLTPALVAIAKERDARFLVTVDNGISSVEGVAAAKACGMRVLVTDHHLPPQQLPDADVIVNPNLVDDPFPSKALAGVGVAFYVLLALRKCLRDLGWFEQQGIAVPNMAHYLDLVALGTVADAVPLDKNNRILVAAGLRRINAGKMVAGIRALLRVAKKDEVVVASDIGFALAPRLNAAGRLEDMSTGVACLLSNSEADAYAFAQTLDGLNVERRAIEQGMSEQAFADVASLLASLEKKRLPCALSLYQPSWHLGVVGILASRVKDKVNRPTIIFANESETVIKGSARSIPGVHIQQVLSCIHQKHPGLMLGFGGHAMAAGLSLLAKDYAAFKSAFEAAVAAMYSEDVFVAYTETDGVLPDEYFSLSFAELIAAHGPWGQAFPEPSFDGVFAVMDQRLVAAKHLKLVVALQADKSRMFDAIAFNVDLARWPNLRCSFVRMVYRLDINSFQGRRRLQLLVETLDEHCVGAATVRS
jgi:single-stranded-DNA-specific exonuclease